MLALIRRIILHRLFPVSWTLFTIFLLCIPGSIVPGDGIFGLPNLDKVVHVILFGLNVLFWGWHLAAGERSSPRLRWMFVGATVLIIILGIVMEYVQLYFIPNRSFDSWDIVADAVGAVIAGVWLMRS